VKFSKHHWAQPVATRQQEPLNVPSLIDREGNVIAVRRWRALTRGSGYHANSCAFDDQACEREVVNVV